jgi:hypothetical protein
VETQVDATVGVHLVVDLGQEVRGVNAHEYSFDYRISERREAHAGVFVYSPDPLA